MSKPSDYTAERVIEVEQPVHPDTRSLARHIWLSRAIGLVLPALKGKLDGTAIRVPTANVSLIDLTFDAARETTPDEVNSLMEEAARSNRLKGILGINKAPTVSVDFNHDSHSSTFDVTQTQVLDKRFVRVLAWYDNEWGFSNRMVEVAAYFGAMA